MKPLILKPTIQQSQPEPPKVPPITIDIVKQISDESAMKAAQEVSRENMENFNRFQEQNKISQEQIPQERDNGDSMYEDPEGGYLIEKKTEKSLMRRLLDQTLQKALDPPPPSPIEAAVTQVMGQVSAGIAEKMLGSIGGSGGQITSKPGLLSDILNSQFGAGFGQNLGAKLPEIITALTSSIGQKKTEELATAATKAMSQQVTEQQKTIEASNTEKQKDMVLALDVNNPDHVTQYATAMGLSIKAAKGMLQVHQDDIKSERSDKKTISGEVQQTSNNEITQALTVLIQEMSGMKQVISSLQSEIISIKSKPPNVREEVQSQPLTSNDKWSEDETSKVDMYRQQVGVQQRSVTLFQSPIKVDVDSIKGDTDAFFKETPKNVKVEKQEESVLEEVIDNEGKSTFKMSDEKSKEQPKEQLKVQPKEQPKKVAEISTETEEDKKKESSSVELIKPEKNENESTQTNDDIKVEEMKTEEQKPEENINKKRIIRKLIPIKKDIIDVPSHVTEHYDINNNLITEENK